MESLFAVVIGSHAAFVAFGPSIGKHCSEMLASPLSIAKSSIEECRAALASCSQEERAALPPNAEQQLRHYERTLAQARPIPNKVERLTATLFPVYLALAMLFWILGAFVFGLSGESGWIKAIGILICALAWVMDFILAICAIHVIKPFADSECHELKMWLQEFQAELKE